jgi:hypothetical protein
MQEEYSYAVRNRRCSYKFRKLAVANGKKGECFMSAITGKMNDSMKGLDGNIIQPTNNRFEVEVCRVTHWKNREIVELRVFYDPVGMQKPIGVM